MQLLAQAVIKLAGKKEELLQKSFELARQSMHTPAAKKDSVYNKIQNLTTEMDKLNKKPEPNK